MGYDERQQPTSSVTLVAVIGVGLVLAFLGIIVVAAVALFWVRAAELSRAVAMEHRAVAELRRAEVMAHEASDRIEAVPDVMVDFELNLDREGNMSVDGERIGLDQLKAEIAKLKDETSNAFSVHINADPGCPIKHVAAILSVFDELGEIDYRIISTWRPEPSRDESNAER